MITDTHAHLFWDSFTEDRDSVLQRAMEAGVSRMVVVGTDLTTSEQCFELCTGTTGLFPTAGIHPHDAKDSDVPTREAIEALCRRDDCVAVGETGLDYFKEFSPREAQRDNFAWHLNLARQLDKPIVVHSRDAHADTFAMLSDFPGVRGVMHCFTMGPAELPAYLERDFHISFSGVVTYPKNDDNREAAALVPENRLLVETDCPFLAPQGHRGKRNEPALVRKVLEVVAEVRGTELDALAEETSANAAALFGLDGTLRRA